MATYAPLLQGIAIAGSVYNAGTMTTAYRLLPTIYASVQRSPRAAAGQWEFFYWSLSATVPIVDLATIVSVGSLAYVEYKENSTGLAWKIWATAAGIMPIGWVWVRRVMLTPSNKLLALAKPSPAEAETKNRDSLQQRTIELLKEFNSQMGVRMMFPWVVGGLALWASLGL
ncbi:hypothetical protein B0I35DRAFT_474016 [Stachybotrys elegans]|uniref:DUF1772-domain-containing protein n=1 Tax=Stachybotrys elegans TaxID=80388 RepID=A0A8K0T5Y5_9HYPO|nr:hypothetical protein B0I35DRAFT_474016 [Stachybotrys elegans]